jgi:hypothetical protein
VAATVQKFGENERYSQQYAGDIERILARYFCDIAGVLHVPAESSPVQKLGIDILLMLRSGRTLTIDYKTRRGTFTDIMLYYENIEADGRRTPGLITDDNLQMDYLLFYFPETGRAELLDMGLTRQLWRLHSGEWLKRAAVGESGFMLRESESSGRAGIYKRQLLFIPRAEYWRKLYNLGAAG